MIALFLICLKTFVVVLFKVGARGDTELETVALKDLELDCDGRGQGRKGRLEEDEMVQTICMNKRVPLS